MTNKAIANRNMYSIPAFSATIAVRVGVIAPTMPNGKKKRLKANPLLDVGENLATRDSKVGIVLSKKNP